MVGRRNSLSVTKRSLRNAESAVDRRPRRVVQSKLVDDTVGLSRQEEQELNKALYASLQENRRNRLFLGNDSSSNSTSSNGANTSKASSISHKSSSSRTSSNLRSDRSLLGQRRSLRTGTLSPKHNLRQTTMSAPRLKKIKSAISGSLKRKSSSDVSTSNINLDESSQDSVRSSTSSANGSKRKIHAQRKFAQGCSLPGTPSCTPVKSSTPPTKVMSFRIPKTEDFLTFLCLRGSSILPPHLDFFNYSREEMAVSEAGSRTASSAGKSKSQRESTPDSTSTSSGANEEVAEAASMATPSPTGRGSNSLLAKRSAARASAGTPETARGIVSLRQGLQRKVSTSSSSSSSARFPVSSPSRSFNISRLTNSTPPYRNKFYFTPEKSPSPSKASGIRRGEFTPPSLFTSLHSDSSCFSKSHTFSPLVCSSSSKLSTPSPRSGLLTSRGSTSSSSTSLSSSSGASKRKHEAPDGCVAGKKVTASSSFNVIPGCRLEPVIPMSSPVPHSAMSSPVPHSAMSSPVPHSAMSSPVPHSAMSLPVPHSAMSSPVPHSAMSSPVPHSAMSSPVSSLCFPLSTHSHALAASPPLDPQTAAHCTLIRKLQQLARAAIKQSQAVLSKKVHVLASVKCPDLIPSCHRSIPVTKCRAYNQCPANCNTLATNHSHHSPSSKHVVCQLSNILCHCTNLLTEHVSQGSGQCILHDYHSKCMHVSCKTAQGWLCRCQGHLCLPSPCLKPGDGTRNSHIDRNNSNNSTKNRHLDRNIITQNTKHSYTSRHQPKVFVLPCLCVLCSGIVSSPHDSSNSQGMSPSQAFDQLENCGSHQLDSKLKDRGAASGGQCPATGSHPEQRDVPNTGQCPATGSHPEQRDVPNTGQCPATGSHPGQRDVPNTGQCPATGSHPEQRDVPNTGQCPATGSHPGQRDVPNTGQCPATGSHPGQRDVPNISPYKCQLPDADSRRRKKRTQRLGKKRKKKCVKELKLPKIKIRIVRRRVCHEKTEYRWGIIVGNNSMCDQQKNQDQRVLHKASIKNGLSDIQRSKPLEPRHQADPGQDRAGKKTACHRDFQDFLRIFNSDSALASIKPAVNSDNVLIHHKPAVNSDSVLIHHKPAVNSDSILIHHKPVFSVKLSDSLSSCKNIVDKRTDRILTGQRLPLLNVLDDHSYGLPPYITQHPTADPHDVPALLDDHSYGLSPYLTRQPDTSVGHGSSVPDNLAESNRHSNDATSIQGTPNRHSNDATSIQGTPNRRSNDATSIQGTPNRRSNDATSIQGTPNRHSNDATSIQGTPNRRSNDATSIQGTPNRYSTAAPSMQESLGGYWGFYNKFPNKRFSVEQHLADRLSLRQQIIEAFSKVAREGKFVANVKKQREIVGAHNKEKCLHLDHNGTFFGQQLDHDSQQLDHDSQQLNHNSQQLNHDSQQLNHDSQQLNHDGQQQNHDSQQLDHDSQQLNHDSQQQNHDSQQLDHGSQQLNHDSQPLKHDSQQLDHDSQQLNHDSQQLDHDSQPLNHDSQPLKHDSQQLDHDSQQLNHDSQQLDRDSQQLDHGSQQLNHDSQQLNHDSQQLNHDSQQLNHDSHLDHDIQVDHDSQPDPDSQQDHDSQQLDHDSQQDHGSQQLNHDSQQLDHDSQQDHYSQQLDHDSQQLDHDSQQLDHDSQQLDHDSQQLDHDSQQLDHDSQQLDHDSQHLNHDSQQLNHDNEQLDHDSQQLDHDFQQLDHDSQQLDHDCQQLDHDSQQQNHDSQQLNHDSQQLNHDSQQLDQYQSVEMNREAGNLPLEKQVFCGKNHSNPDIGSFLAQPISTFADSLSIEQANIKFVDPKTSLEQANIKLVDPKTSLEQANIKFVDPKTSILEQANIKFVDPKTSEQANIKLVDPKTSILEQANIKFVDPKTSLEQANIKFVDPKISLEPANIKFVDPKTSLEQANIKSVNLMCPILDFVKSYSGNSSCRSICKDIFLDNSSALFLKPAISGEGLIKWRNKQIQTNLDSVLELDESLVFQAKEASNRFKEEKVLTQTKEDKLERPKKNRDNDSRHIYTDPVLEKQVKAASFFKKSLVAGRCLCQREIEKHQKQLHKCLCSFCKIKFSRMTVKQKYFPYKMVKKKSQNEMRLNLMRKDADTEKRWCGNVSHVKEEKPVIIDLDIEEAEVDREEQKGKHNSDKHYPLIMVKDQPSSSSVDKNLSLFQSSEMSCEKEHEMSMLREAVPASEDDDVVILEEDSKNVVSSCMADIGVPEKNDVAIDLSLSSGTQSSSRQVSFDLVGAYTGLTSGSHDQVLTASQACHPASYGRTSYGSTELQIETPTSGRQSSKVNRRKKCIASLANRADGSVGHRKAAAKKKSKSRSLDATMVSFTYPTNQQSYCYGRDSTFFSGQPQQNIVLHSYGSLHTGQGFAVINGQLKHCEILDKRHILPETGIKSGYLAPFTARFSALNLNPTLESVDTQCLSSSRVCRQDTQPAEAYSVSNNYFENLSRINYHNKQQTQDSSLLDHQTSSVYQLQKRFSLGRSIYLHHDEDDAGINQDHPVVTNGQNSVAFSSSRTPGQASVTQSNAGTSHTQVPKLLYAPLSEGNISFQTSFALCNPNNSRPVDGLYKELDQPKQACPTFVPHSKTSQNDNSHLDSNLYQDPCTSHLDSNLYQDPCTSHLDSNLYQDPCTSHLDSYHPRQPQASYSSFRSNTLYNPQQLHPSYDPLTSYNPQQPHTSCHPLESCNPYNSIKPINQHIHVTTKTHTSSIGSGASFSQHLPSSTSSSVVATFAGKGSYEPITATGTFAGKGSHEPITATGTFVGKRSHEPITATGTFAGKGSHEPITATGTFAGKGSHEPITATGTFAGKGSHEPIIATGTFAGKGSHEPIIATGTTFAGKGSQCLTSGLLRSEERSVSDKSQCLTSGHLTSDHRSVSDKSQCLTTGHLTSDHRSVSDKSQCLTTGHLTSDHRSVSDKSQCLTSGHLTSDHRSVSDKSQCLTTGHLTSDHRSVSDKSQCLTTGHLTSDHRSVTDQTPVPEEYSPHTSDLSIRHFNDIVVDDMSCQNVLDVIMEELKVQITLIREEIMNENIRGKKQLMQKSALSSCLDDLNTAIDLSKPEQVIQSSANEASLFVDYIEIMSDAED